MALPKVRKVSELWAELLWGLWSCGRRGGGPQSQLHVLRTHGWWVFWGSKHRGPKRQQWRLIPQQEGEDMGGFRESLRG